MTRIRDALLLQKEELEGRSGQVYIKRDARIKEINSNLIKVITGPRRAGKSFFAMHEIPNHDFAYANFDDEALVNVNDYNEIVSELNSIYKKPQFILFDEIQNLYRWELFVNRLQRRGYNLVITGSNSRLLSTELSTHLTGRHVQVEILPFSFREMVSSMGRELTEAELKTKFNDYAVNGGYPEPFVKGLNYKDYLSTLFDSVLYKDIVKRYSIRRPEVIGELAVYLISNVANEFSYNNLQKMIKINSQHTVKKYIDYLHEAYISFEVKKYSYKVREQITSNKKLYCIDNGLIAAKGFRHSNDIGKLYENLVAIELKRRATNEGFEFYYWKNQQQEEIDFVLVKGTRVSELLQVSSDITEENTKNREIRALLKGSRDLKCSNLTVLTDDYENTEKVEWFGIERQVNFLPTWKWVLGSHIPR